jgi:hypothetical protein
MEIVEEILHEEGSIEEEGVDMLLEEEGGVDMLLEEEEEEEEGEVVIKEEIME